MRFAGVNQRFAGTRSPRALAHEQFGDVTGAPVLPDEIDCLLFNEENSPSDCSPVSLGDEDATFILGDTIHQLAEIVGAHLGINAAVGFELMFVFLQAIDE